ncbi:hypothetical protein AAVH_06547 [Aphelenchoides avenae]|nr:hypothetical protein AAVH_06547 [Aphelenchus avenae]
MSDIAKRIVERLKQRDVDYLHKENEMYTNIIKEAEGRNAAPQLHTPAEDVDNMMRISKERKKQLNDKEADLVRKRSQERIPILTALVQKFNQEPGLITEQQLADLSEADARGTLVLMTKLMQSFYTEFKCSYKWRSLKKLQRVQAEEQRDIWAEGAKKLAAKVDELEDEGAQSVMGPRFPQWTVLAKELEAEVAKASNKISKTAAAIDRMLDAKDNKENDEMSTAAKWNPMKQLDRSMEKLRKWTSLMQTSTQGTSSNPELEAAKAEHEALQTKYTKLLDQVACMQTDLQRKNDDIENLKTKLREEKGEGKAKKRGK